LMDGPLSIIRSDDPAASNDPNQHAEQIIESVEISEARYCGNGTSFKIEFNPWLNTIVGGRGTGKSTVLEFMRTVLRRENELDNIEELRQTYDQFISIPEGREDRGALTDNTQINLCYESNIARFRLQWSQRGDAESIMELPSDGSERTSQGSIRQRFPVRIYSQKQIYNLSQRPGALLGIIDDDPSVNRTEWEERWRSEETRFLSLRAKAREISAGLGEENTLKGELEDIKRKLALYESSGHGEILKRYQWAMLQQQVIEEFESVLEGITLRMPALQEELTPLEISTDFFDTMSNTIDNSILEQANSTQKEVVDILFGFSEIASKIEQIIDEWKAKRKTSSWQQFIIESETKYRELVKKLEVEGTDPDAYGLHVQRRQTLETRIAAIAGQKKQLREVEASAQQSLQLLLQIRRELTQKRVEFLNRALEENIYVQMEVIPYGARENVESEFRDIIGRDHPTFESDINRLLSELYNNSNPNDIGAFENRLQQMKENVSNISLPNVRDQRFINHLTSLKNDKPESIDRLFVWFPEDSLNVSYSPTGDGQDFRSIQQGSPGQKTAAILAFLLSYGDEPMILDQPEDDLDNHLIYDLIVRQIRENKRRRQIIIVTHNPNIVVNGDAELVIPMDFAVGQCQLRADDNGTIFPDGLQNNRIREEICRIMEGGHEAFEKRYIRITGGSRHA